MKKRPPIEKLVSHSEVQKVAEIAPFDREDFGAGLPGKPLTPAQRKQWARIRHKARRGRRIGNGMR